MLLFKCHNQILRKREQLLLTDSESDDPNDYVGLTSVASEGTKTIIARKKDEEFVGRK